MDTTPYHVKLFMIISEHIHSIMQVLNTTHNHLYSNNLILTKCLNTSVLLTCIVIGSNKLTSIQECDVDETRERNKIYELNTNPKTSLTSKLSHNLMYDLTKSSSKWKSSFYYVMLTDAYLNHSKDSSKTLYIPGHVFIINKNNITNELNVYQSYINEYDLEEYMQISNLQTNIKRTLKKILEHISSKRKWDESLTNLWYNLSNVNAKQFEDYETSNILLCYKKFNSNAIHRNIKRNVNNIYKQVKKQINENNLNIFDLKKSYANSAKGKDIYALQNDILIMKKKLEIYK